MIDTQAILDFWFGDIRGGWTADDGKWQLWFGGKSNNDAIIQKRFGTMIDAALAEDENAKIDGRESLARIVLLDQMTRMIFRGGGRAFVGDDKALALCRAGLHSGADKTMPPVYRQFFYLPLEHSEEMAHQELCVRLFTTLRDENPPLAKMLNGALEYAIKHRDIIARFGRFPHRNIALNRQSTAAEKEYLKDAEKFGQG